MSEETSPITSIPPGSPGDKHQDEILADQVQHLPHNNTESSTASRPTDTIIPMEEATLSTSNSFGQQNDQERPESSSPTTLIQDRIPLTIKKALVLDISKDKGWVASIFETLDASGRNRKLHLQLNRLNDSELETLDSTEILMHEEITKHMPQDMGNYYYFLSVSPTGERVALSFLPAQELSEMEDKKIRLVKTLKCLIFKANQKEKKIPLDNNKLRLQGKAVFLPNGHLALITGQKVMVYDCEAGYGLLKWFDISPLMQGIFKFYWADASLLGKTSSVNLHQENEDQVERFPAEIYLQLSEFVNQNMLVSTYQSTPNHNNFPSPHNNVIRLWSLENGCRLTSFKTATREEYPPEMPLALSKDGKFIATFSESDNKANVYHVKTGLLTNTLKTKSENDLHNHHSAVNQKTYAEFHHNDSFLFLIKIRQWEPYNDTNNNASIIFEVWDISAEKAIFQKTEKFRLDWMAKSSHVRPFVVELDYYSPAYAAVYTALGDDDSFYFRIIPLDVFRARDPSSSNARLSWTPKSFGSLGDTGPTDYQEITGNLNDYSNAICFQSNENPNVLLRVGGHTVQLWCVSDITSRRYISTNDKLIYISTFVPPLYTLDQPYFHLCRRIVESTVIDSGGEEAIIQSNRNSTLSENTENNVNSTQQGSEQTSIYDNSSWNQQGVIFMDKLENALSIKILPYHHFLPERMRKSVYLPSGEFLSDDYVCTEYHYLESAINTLSYLHEMPKQKRHKNSKMLFVKTKELIVRCIERMKLENSRYFTTLSGSCSLSLLAAFSDGREILFRIIQTDELALGLVSYARLLARTKIQGNWEDRNENALTILIEKHDFTLYDLLFNRVILDAANLGAGAYSVISDTLIFLQVRGDTDILANSCRKLQFLQILPPSLSVVSGEIDKSMPIKTVRNNFNIEFRKLKPKATNEQIPIYGNHWYNSLTYRLSLLRRGTVEQWRPKSRAEPDECGMHSHHYKGHAASDLFSICVVPYIYLCSYDTYAEDVERDEDNPNRDKSLLLPVFERIEDKLIGIDFDLTGKTHTQAKICQHLIQFPIRILEQLIRLTTPKDGTPNYKRKSALIQLALNQHENDLFSQKDTVLEALLHFKWETKIKYRFFLVCLVYAVYYVSFSVGVLFSNAVFDYSVGATIAGDFKHILTITLMLISCGSLWFQEVRQFLKMGSSCLKYFSSLYNWVDLFALTLPVVNLWQMLTVKPGLEELGAIATIVIWLHMVLRLRAFAFFGVTVETIIQLMKSVYKTLIIMLLVIFAFTNAFIVLLARKDDAYFQEKYSGAMVLNISDSSSENAVNYNDDSSSNNFKNPFKAFSTLWFFLYGVWDPINDGDAGDDYMIMVLAILFSFLTVLLFFNLVIALMSSRAEEVKALGKSVWLSHFAAVIAEIEQLWCTKSERVSRDNNPAFIYYIAKKTDIRRQADLLEEESNELVQKLQARYEKRARMRHS